MLKKNKVTLIITSVVTLLPILVGLFLWDQLPEQVPIHWGIDGEVDDWSSKSFAVFGFPCIMLAMQWVCMLASLADPKRVYDNHKAFHVVLWICPCISLLLGVLVYATALGYSMEVEILMPLLVGCMFVVIGNLLPKMRQSYTMGIKLPWTLDNEENWNKTHHFAGWVWTLGGCVTMVTALIGSFWVLLGVIIAMVLIPTLYSYLLYRKQQKGTA